MSTTSDIQETIHADNMRTLISRVNLRETFQYSWSLRSRYLKLAPRPYPHNTFIRPLTESGKSRESTIVPIPNSEQSNIIFDDTIDQGKENRSRDDLPYARIVPESRSYFSVQPTFTDSLVALDQILENYKNLPLSDPSDVPKVAWLSGRDYKNLIGESVKTSRYQHMLRVLKRLNQIHPAMMPPEVEEAMKPFRRDVVPETSSTKISAIDESGRSLGIGRRKTSVGKAWLIEGTGEVYVNGKTLPEAFGRVHDRETVIWPLKVTQRINKYNLWCRTEGGGTTGQAEALTLAVAKALLSHEPALKPALRRAGCVTRDPRKVERKKPGHLKARKMPAWVKR